jgi:ketosteroid isomerase-like protein
MFHDGDFFGDLAMDEAYAVVKQWEAAFNAGDADAVTALYAPDTVLC